MISSISGKVTSKAISSIVVEVGGVGILVQVPGRVAAGLSIGNLVNFHTYLIVREDALTLYGFTEITERDFFELLLTVTGVGPKVAQSILANSDATAIATAIISSNHKLLESVPGLGKKGAQRLVLELKDKVSSFAAGVSKSNLSVTNQVENALQGLGYSAKEASAMITAIAGTEKIEKLDMAEILKLALKSGVKK
jgi:Holliday junction DNA helicase RuvA